MLISAKSRPENDGNKKVIKFSIVITSVSDPHPFFADPDPDPT
jgi:hypothetical protein